MKLQLSKVSKVGGGIGLLGLGAVTTLLLVGGSNGSLPQPLNPSQAAATGAATTAVSHTVAKVVVPAPVRATVAVRHTAAAVAAPQEVTVSDPTPAPTTPDPTPPPTVATSGNAVESTDGPISEAPGVLRAPRPPLVASSAPPPEIQQPTPTPTPSPTPSA
jgi:hypothetical protein